MVNKNFKGIDKSLPHPPEAQVNINRSMRPQKSNASTISIKPHKNNTSVFGINSQKKNTSVIDMKGAEWDSSKFYRPVEDNQKKRMWTNKNKKFSY